MKTEKETIGNAVIFSGGTIASRLLGLVRDILFAAVLGAGWSADVFIAAFRIPNFARRMLQEGATALAFIPLFNKEKVAGGEKAAFAFGRAALVQTVFIALVFTLLFVYGADALTVLMVPGFEAQPLLIELTSKLMKVCFLYLPLVGVATICSAILMALGRFAGPSLTPAALNIGLISAALYALVTDMPIYHTMYALCIGLLAGGVLQVLVQLPPLYMAGFRLISPVQLDSSASKQFARTTPLAVAGSAAYQLGVLISMFMASFLPEGNVSSLYFAERLMELPLAIIGVSFGAASLSSFSVLVAEGRGSEMGKYLNKMLSLCMLLSFPAAVGMGALSSSLVVMFFDHGYFTPDGVFFTSTALLFYTPALPAVALCRPLLSALNAKSRVGITLAASFISLAAMVILILLLRHMGIAGIALSASLAAWINFFILLMATYRSRIGTMTAFSFPIRSLITYFAFSVVMYGVLFVISRLAISLGMNNILYVAVSIIAGAAVYLGLCAVFYRDDLLSLCGILKK